MTGDGVLAHRIWGVRRFARIVQSRLAASSPGFEFGEGFKAFGRPILRCVAGARVSAGRDLVLISDSEFSAVGVAHPCVIDAMSSEARVVIGDDVGMSGATVCCARSITIGDRVLVGADAVITDNDLHPVHVVPRRYAKGAEASPVVVEDDVFIGMRAVILKGVRVGRAAVVGIGSVVTQDVPAGSIVAGVPARIVGEVRAFDSARGAAG